MAIYLKDKKIAPYRGDYKPVNIYQGAQKIAGWHDAARTGDSALEWDDTYNDRVGGYVHGQSEQVQTVQGKNICPTQADEWESGEYLATTGAKMSTASRARVKTLRNVTPSTVYYCNVYLPANLRFVLRAYDSAGVFTRSIEAVTNGNIFTTQAAEYYISITIYDHSSTSWTWDYYYNLLTTNGLNPFICLNSEEDKTYVPFTTNSPSPDYPSPILSAQPVVQSRGRNLFDFNNSFPSGWNTIKLSNGYRVTLSNSWSVGWFDVIGLLPNTQYRLRGNIYQRGTLTSAAYSICPRETPTTLIATGTTTLQSDILTPRFTTPASGNIRVYMYSNITATAMDSSCDFTDIIISLGTDIIPYTPYRPPSSVTLPELRAIPLLESATEWTYIRDGVKYWADTAQYVGGGWWDVTRRCGLWVFTGVSPYQIIKNDNAANSYLYYKTAIPNKKRGIGVCTHFSHVLSWPETAGKFSCSTPGHISTLFINFRGIVSADNATIPNSNEANAWLAAQYAVGTPVVVLYQLAEPTTECIHLGTLASFPRYTHAEQIQDGLKAHLQLNAKVIDR